MVLLPASGTIHYVDVNSTNPVAPFVNWPTAATTIQDAIDAAVPGDEILVSSGVYETGTRAAAETDTPTLNRVAVTKPVTIQSLSGPGATIIRGYQLPDQTNGADAVRCVYLTNGAALIGFTLTGGATRTDDASCGGGVVCQSSQAVLSNCVITGNSAAYWGGGANAGTLLNCVISNNTAGMQGGGAAGSPPGFSSGVADCVLSNCLLSGNSASLIYGGGGAADALLISCQVTANFSPGLFRCSLINCLVSHNQGGGGICQATNCVFSYNTGSGANQSHLEGCTLIGNSSPDVGGGARGGFIRNCVIYNNTAGFGGGGTAEAVAINCLIISNSAPNGGGDLVSHQYNCTLVGNSASINAGGTFGSSLNNCIVYYNTAPVNENNDPTGTDVSINFCCTTPTPPIGTGNLTAPPLFVDAGNGNFHLQPNSPCINAGENDYTTISGDPPFTDLGNSPRISGNTVDIGAYEFQFLGPAAPLLSIALAGNQVVLSWPASATNYVLEATTDLSSSTPKWLQQTQGIEPSGGNFVITNNPVAPRTFYRLRRN